LLLCSFPDSSDWQAAAAGAWGNLWHQKTRGASTLSMQLVGLLDAENTELDAVAFEVRALRGRR